jgi:hypothetical protein
MKRRIKLIERSKAANEVLEEMGLWLKLSQETYKPAVMLFSLRLSPEELLEAFWWARSRKPDGGQDAFLYFCGVCHKMPWWGRGRHSRN